MHDIPVIGLTGVAGAGKSTAAEILQDRGYTLVKFAGPLKAMCRALGLGMRELEGDLKEVPHPLLCGKSPREFMQRLGTEFGREQIGENFWEVQAMDVVRRVLQGGGKVVIDDCRFENEARAVRRVGGVVFRIERTGYGPVNGHVSDNTSFEVDATIQNDDDISMLADAVDLAIAVIKGGRAKVIRPAPFAAGAFVL